MKKIILAIMAMALLISSVSGISLTFQDSGEFTSYVSVTSAPITWTVDSNGGNNYLSGGGTFRNTDPLPMTYAAATNLVSGGLNAQLIDSTGLVIMDTLGTTGAGRYEVKVVGGTAYLYRNGILADTSVPLAQNPSYVAWQSAQAVDDVIWGTSENRYIFGSPQQGYFIRKDMINPAASGFYAANGTLISSFNMTTTWGIGDTNASQTIQLKEWSSGNIAGSFTTTAGAQSGSISWPIQDDVINNPLSAYGYYITTIPGSGEVSTVIPYISYGASVTFDQATYARGDTAIISYSIDSGGYWNTATYSYRLDTLDVYGNVIDSQAVTTQTGAKSVTFSSTDTLGVYYAVLIATPTAVGSDIWMNYDYAELTGYLVLTGKVYNAETEAPIPVCNISIVQDSIAFNKVTSVDGNYTTNVAFSSGAVISVNVTSAGFIQYTDTFTPLEGKTIGLNFTLIPTPTTFSGIALGGVVRDNVYGRPIPGVSVTAANSTYSQSFTSLSNSVGYYLIDTTTGASLVNHRCYVVSGAKTGYTSVTSYFRCVEGV